LAPAGRGDYGNIAGAKQEVGDDGSSGGGALVVSLAPPCALAHAWDRPNDTSVVATIRDAGQWNQHAA
jgi:hypothetical protein